jgi:ribosomal protein S18 acetylase RimI-like enzyme
MMERRQMQIDEPFALKNTPLRPRERQRLLESPDAIRVGNEDGELILLPHLGQLRLYWGFIDQETMRQVFLDMFEAIREDITPERADYVSMDLAGLPTREWLKPLLQEADFEFFAEWMDMQHPSLDPEEVPEFPDDLTMRRATDDDLDRCRTIWNEAHGDYGDGPRSFDAMVEASSWIGALEEDGEVIAFAINGPVDRAEADIFTAVVAPEARGKGYGDLILQAACFQLTTQEARRATIRVRPDIPQALKTCSDNGFKPLRSGIEYRRTTDQAEIDRVREERRFVGVKARFGRWR